MILNSYGPRSKKKKKSQPERWGSFSCDFSLKVLRDGQKKREGKKGGGAEGLAICCPSALLLLSLVRFFSEFNPPSGCFRRSCHLSSWPSGPRRGGQFHFSPRREAEAKWKAPFGRRNNDPAALSGSGLNRCEWSRSESQGGLKVSRHLPPSAAPSAFKVCSLSRSASFFFLLCSSNLICRSSAACWSSLSWAWRKIRTQTDFWCIVWGFTIHSWLKTTKASHSSQIQLEHTERTTSYTSYYYSFKIRVP